MPTARGESLERQASLYEEEEAAVRDLIRATRRRESLAAQLAIEKGREAETVRGHADETRLRAEAGLCERQAQIFATEAQTLEREAERALAQATTARQKRAAEG